jgi:hypothetical protein
MYFLKIKGTGHLITKKDEGAKMYFTKCFESAHLSYLCFSLKTSIFQFNLPKNKNAIEC